MGKYLYPDFLKNARSYDACRRLWRQMCRELLARAPREWRSPWFESRGGNRRRLLRDGDPIATAVSADWRRGVRIRQESVYRRIPEMVLWFDESWIGVPGDYQQPGVETLVLTCKLSTRAITVFEQLLSSWIVTEAPKQIIVAEARSLGVHVAFWRDHERDEPLSQTDS